MPDRLRRRAGTDRDRDRRRGLCGDAAGQVPARRAADRATAGRRRAQHRRARARPLLRRVRRVLAAFCALVLIGALGFTGLLLVTPSVASAPALVRTQDLAHDAPYPGPPVPPRFAAALIATEDHRFYSEPGIDLFAVARVGWSYLSGQGDQG